MLMRLLFHKQTSLLPICAKAPQIGLDATIEIAFAAALAVFPIAQFLRYALEWRIFMKTLLIMQSQYAVLFVQMAYRVIYILG